MRSKPLTLSRQMNRVARSKSCRTPSSEIRNMNLLHFRIRIRIRLRRVPPPSQGVPGSPKKNSNSEKDPSQPGNDRPCGQLYSMPTGVYGHLTQKSTTTRVAKRTYIRISFARGSVRRWMITRRTTGVSEGWIVKLVQNEKSRLTKQDFQHAHR